MNELKIIKSTQFGDMQCDIYGNGKDFYMTRSQIGTALEYSDPSDAIRKIHERKKERLNKYSVVVKLSGTDGKLYNTYLYTRKGIMEICRHSEQPKADAFIDWVWDVMDDLITGKTNIVPARRSLSEVNNAAKIITQTLKEAGMSPQFRAVTIKSLYAPMGVEIPLDGIILDKHFYDATAIAKRLGIISKTGSPHNKAVSAIIAMLGIDDSEREVVPFQNQASGHSGTNYQYAESVIGKVSAWLEQNDYPAVINHNGKNYSLCYEYESA